MYVNYYFNSEIRYLVFYFETSSLFCRNDPNQYMENFTKSNCGDYISKDIIYLSGIAMPFISKQQKVCFSPLLTELIRFFP